MQSEVGSAGPPGYHQSINRSPRRVSRALELLCSADTRFGMESYTVDNLVQIRSTLGDADLEVV